MRLMQPSLPILLIAVEMTHAQINPCDNYDASRGRAAQVAECIDEIRAHGNGRVEVSSSLRACIRPGDATTSPYTDVRITKQPIGTPETVSVSWAEILCAVEKIYNSCQCGGGLVRGFTPACNANGDINAVWVAVAGAGNGRC